VLQENVEITQGPGQLPISDRQLRSLLRFPGVIALIWRLVFLVPSRWWPRRTVAISQAIMLPPDSNAAALMRDDALASALVKAVTPLLHPTCELGGTLLQSGVTYTGPQGLREWALEWYAPYVSYRVVQGKAVDLGGDRVLVPYNCFGRIEGSTAEIEIVHAGVFTFRDGKIARAEIYLNRAEALKAVEPEE
jgi:SnoaL-like domain